MDFAVPSALLWSLLAAPIVVFYILKVRLRRAPTSTSMFWSQVYDEKPPRSIWESLKHLLSLLAQLVLLLLLVFALADPILEWQQKSAQRIVLILDNSASMQSADITPSRFEAARTAALAAADGLRFGDQMAVIVAGDHPRVVCGLSDQLPTLKRVIESVGPTDAPTNLEPALELARNVIGDHEHGRTIVFTDGCYDRPSPVSPQAAASPEAASPDSAPLAGDATGRAAAAPEPPNVEVRLFGSSAGNVGITQFQVRRSLIDPLGYEVLTAVRNASPTAVECRLELELNGLPIDVLPLKLAPEEVWTRSLQKTTLDGGFITARIERLAAAEEAAESAEPFRDALDRDNAAYAVLPPRAIQQVLLVTPGNLFLQRVFEANPLVQLQVADQPPAQWPSNTLVVLHRQPLETLPPGNVWVIDPAADSDAWTLGGDLENPIVTEQDAASPLMRHVALDNVLMPKARKLTFPSKPHVLAGVVSGDPVFAEIHRPGGKLLVLTVDLEEGDLTFRTAFPIMVTNALGWFSGDAGELTPALATGSVAHMQLPDDTPPGRLWLESPTGERLPVLAADSEQNDATTVDSPSADISATERTERAPITVGPLETCGVWRILTAPDDPAAEPETLSTLACNLSNPQESDVRSPDDPTPAGGAGRTFQAGGWFSRPLWFYLASAALLLALIEWLLYQRRVIR